MTLRASEIASALEAHLTLWLAGMALLASLAFVLDAPLGRWVLMSAFALACVGTRWLAPTSWLRALSIGAGALLLLVVSVVLAGAHFETSWDARAYHIPAALALDDGWNPFRAPNLVAFHNGCSLIAPARHYAKVAWLWGAAIYAWTGRVDTLSSPNLLTAWIAWSAVLGLCRRCLGMGRALSVLLSVLAVLNPILVYAVFSAEVDGMFANLILALGANLVWLVAQPSNRRLVLAGLQLVLLVNVKLTGLVFGGMLYAGAAAYLLWARRSPSRAGQTLAAGTAAGLVAVLLVGFNPYVTNILSHGNPFFPAWVPGEPSAQIIWKQADPEFLKKNRLAKFVIANVSVPRGKKDGDWRFPVFRMPLTHLEPPPRGHRFNGFGPLFATALVASLVLLAWSRSREAWLIAGVILATVFVTDSGWIARYVPQLWVLPLLAVGTAWHGRRRGPALVAAAVALMMAANAGVVVAHAPGWTQRIQTGVYWTTLEAVKATSPSAGPFNVAPVRLAPRHEFFRCIERLRLLEAGVIARQNCKPGARLTDSVKLCRGAARPAPDPGLAAGLRGSALRCLAGLREGGGPP